MRCSADRGGAAIRAFAASRGWREALAAPLPHPTPRSSVARSLGACLLGSMMIVGAARAAPVKDPDNGHYYEAVARDAGITWNAANDQANARMFMGMHGHLATITSPAENAFLVQNLPDAVDGYYCLGGFQS